MLLLSGDHPVTGADIQRSGQLVVRGELQLGLGHECQRPAFQVLEEGHPFFRTVRVFVDQVRSAREFDALRFKVLVCLPDVFDTKV